MSLDDWVRVVGVAVGVLGAFLVASNAVSVVREHLMRLLGRRPAYIRIAGVTAYVDPPANQQMTFQEVQRYMDTRLAMLGLTEAARKADEGVRSREGHQASLNQRAVFPIAAGIALPGLPDTLLNHRAAPWVLICLSALSLIVAIPDRTTLKAGKWMRDHHMPWASR